MEPGNLGMELATFRVGLANSGVEPADSETEPAAYRVHPADNTVDPAGFQVVPASTSAIWLRKQRTVPIPIWLADRIEPNLTGTGGAPAEFRIGAAKSDMDRVRSRIVAVGSEGFSAELAVEPA